MICHQANLSRVSEIDENNLRRWKIFNRCTCHSVYDRTEFSIKPTL